MGVVKEGFFFWVYGFPACGGVQVIFTNEATIDMYTKARKRAIDSKIGRLNALLALLEVPVQVSPPAYAYSSNLT